jgi:hypothetical protein
MTLTTSLLNSFCPIGKKEFLILLAKPEMTGNPQYFVERQRQIGLPVIELGYSPTVDFLIGEALPAFKQLGHHNPRHK